MNPFDLMKTDRVFVVKYRETVVAMFRVRWQAEKFIEDSASELDLVIVDQVEI